MELREVGGRLYAECCARRQAKPNGTILKQLQRVDLMNMRCIDATDTFLGAPGVHAVLDTLAHLRCVEELRLPQNGVDLACVRHLCALLESGAHPSLRRVDLSANALTVPCVRALWQTACATPTLTHVDISGSCCGDEWSARLQRTLEGNQQLQTEGYLPPGTPRVPAGAWQTVFLLLLGSPAHVARYTEVVLPVLASYAATSLRLRLAPLVISASDGRALVDRKLARCGCPATNAHRTWCVALLDAGAPLSELEQYALQRVMAEGPLPPPAPLRDGAGERRAPTHRPAQTLFLYYADPPSAAVEAGEGGEGLAPTAWLRIAGVDLARPPLGPQWVALAAQPQPEAFVLTEASYLPRCLSDVLDSLTTVYMMPPSAGPERLAEPPAPVSAAEWALGVQVETVLPQACAEVMNYLDESPAPSEERVSVPLVLYSARDAGAAEVLAYAARTARRSASAGAPSAAEGKNEPPVWRVVEMDVGCGNTSLIVFLLRLLEMFAPSGATSTGGPPLFTQPSVAALVRAVQDSLATYAGPPTALVIPALDTLDMCGLPLSTAVAWLPARLPGNLRCVLSVQTESPLLGALRQRSPQPREHLILPLRTSARLELLRAALRRQQLSVPGLSEGESGVAGGAAAHSTPRALTLAESAYVARPGTASTLFPRLVAACVRQRLAGEATAQVLSDTDAETFVVECIPATVEEAITTVAESVATLGGGEVTRWVLACLTVAPLPVPDLQYVCESLAGCEAQSAMPVLLLLVDAGLAVWRPDSTVYVDSVKVRTVLAKGFCGPALVERAAVMVESRLYQLVTTSSPEAVDSFRLLVPLMIYGGNVALAARLLLHNTPVLDHLLRGRTREGSNDLYVVDGLLRLLTARGLLSEVLSGAPDVTLPSEAGAGAEGTAALLRALDSLDPLAITRAIADVLRLGRAAATAGVDVFACGVWARSSASPLALDAQRRAGRPPYAALTPTNTGAGAAGDGFSLDCGGRTVLGLHVCDDLEVGAATPAYHVAVTTSEGVCMFELTEEQLTAGQRIAPVATLHQPFLATTLAPGAGEACGRVIAAWAAAGSRVVVLSPTAVVLWDYRAQSSVLLTDTLVVPEVTSLSATGSRLLARQPRSPHAAESAYVVVDVLRRCPVRFLPRRSRTAVHSALFCGSSPTVVEGSTVYRYHSEPELCQAGSPVLGPGEGRGPIVMSHDGLVTCAASSADGRLLATSTGLVVWVWLASTGELMHRLPMSDTVLCLALCRSGAQLLCRQPSGLALWRTATGTCVGALQDPFTLVDATSSTAALLADEGVGSVAIRTDPAPFSDDGTRIVGAVGSFAVVWDSRTCRRTCATLTAAGGPVVAVASIGGALLVAEGGGGDVWGYGSVPSAVVEGATGRVTSAARGSRPSVTLAESVRCVLRSPWVTSTVVRDVCTDPTGTVMACCDELGRVRVFSLVSGEPIAWCDGGEAAEAQTPVLCAMLMDAHTLLYIPQPTDPRLPGTAVLQSLPRPPTAADDPIPSQPPLPAPTICALPRDLLLLAEPAPRVSLCAAANGTFTGLAYEYRGRGRLVVLDTAARPHGAQVLCQLLGHSGSLRWCGFFDSFAFTVGATDRMVRLWSLSEPHRGAERVGYEHPLPITAATADPASPGVLLLLDLSGALYTATVASITSPSRASFVVTARRLPSLERWAATHSATGMLFLLTSPPPQQQQQHPQRSSSSLLLLWGSDGTVAVADVESEHYVATVRPGGVCVCAAAAGPSKVALGMADGRVLLCNVLRPPERWGPTTTDTAAPES